VESRVVTSDPNEMLEVMLGIPGVQVLGVAEDEAGLRVEVETVSPDMVCSSCGEPAEPVGRRVVELDSRQPFFGRPLHLSWNTRGWRCVNPACSVSTFFEPAAWRFSAE
jgi:hypothetical protein